MSLEKAKRLEPDKTSIREALGRAYFRSGRYRRAASEFSAVVERNPGQRLRPLLPRPLAREARRQARRQPAPVAGRGHAPGPRGLPALPRSAEGGVGRQSAVGSRQGEGSGPARQRGVRLGRRRGRRRDRHRARGAARRRRRRTGRRRPTGSPTRSRGCACSTATEERDGPLPARRRRRRRSASASSRSTATPGEGCGRASRRLPSRPTAERLYELFCERAARRAGCRSRRGASEPGCRSALTNEGPVTLLLEA